MTSPQAFQDLRDRGINVRRRDHTMATLDHSIPTTGPRLQMIPDEQGLTWHDRMSRTFISQDEA